MAPDFSCFNLAAVGEQARGWLWCLVVSGFSAAICFDSARPGYRRRTNFQGNGSRKLAWNIAVYDGSFRVELLGHDTLQQHSAGCPRQHRYCSCPLFVCCPGILDYGKPDIVTTSSAHFGDLRFPLGGSSVLGCAGGDNCLLRAPAELHSVSPAANLIPEHYQI